MLVGAIVTFIYKTNTLREQLRRNEINREYCSIMEITSRNVRRFLFIGRKRRRIAVLRDTTALELF